MKKIKALCALLSLLANPTFGLIANFDSLDTGTNHYYRPSTDGSYNWTDADMTFNMDVSWGGYAWDGFTYSDVNDTTTSGYENQYAIYGDGYDQSGSGVYAIAYQGSSTPTISFDYAQTVNGFYINNTTYTALAIIDGYYSATAFTTDDWFFLTITGLDSEGTILDSMIVELANFEGYAEGVDDEEDFMITDWEWIDLTSFGDNVSSLEFTLTSSDTGEWGINTPTYFAIDGIDTVPEPASVLLIAIGSLGIFGYRRWFSRV
jgi:hypothetical protein